MKITVFSRRLAPYAVCFLRTLARRGHAIELIYQPPSGVAPFEPFDLSFCARAVADADGSARREWLSRPDAELPDAALIGGWVEPLERAAGTRLRRLGRHVACAIDNQWCGSLRQHIGIAASPWLLRPFADIAWVAGAPQAEFARRLGFPNIVEGLYCADVAAYSCDVPIVARQPALLFTGRLVADKGLDLLVRAYQKYRKTVKSPLPLSVAGTGPMAKLVQQEPGVNYLGFVQPTELPGLMARCQALVLPSRVEHWGVVIHEAAASALPVLASTHCGAATRFIQHGTSGLLFPPTVSGLVDALLEYHSFSDEHRKRLSNHSLRLAQTWTPEYQVDAFETIISRNP
jgi:glycosyltransferase involved in cell wall biosynthesis